MRLSAILFFSIVCLANLQAQTYLDPTRHVISTPPNTLSAACGGVVPRSLVFDFEPLRDPPTSLDLAVGKTTWGGGPFSEPLYYQFTWSNNASGEFPNFNLFDFWEAPCSAPLNVMRFIFGRLRPTENPPRRDLAVVMTGFPYRTMVYHNDLTPNPSPLYNVQYLDGDGVDAAWGAFSFADILEDLAVTDPAHLGGSQIRIYPNNGDGTLNEQGVYVFSYSARRIILAQINGRTYDDVTLNKHDLVGFDGTVIKIWRNNNTNGLPSEWPYYQEIDLGIGQEISSVAVADINNDGWNDIIVGYNRGARLFRNSADQYGTIDNQAYWAYGPVTPPRVHLVGVGDIGSPTEFGGGESK
ncbi:MAG: VCBS repeat-containing protein [Ignavibacteriae bacterium]|nr:VCBS repeat-containing protein [Ignavibacteriota bacterium]